MTATLVISLTVDQLEELVERAAAKAIAANQPSDILTLEQAAELIGRHPKVLVKYIETKSVPAQRLGREWRFNRRELLDWIRKQPKPEKKK